jgi:Tol biopolymer transport system component
MWRVAFRFAILIAYFSTIARSFGEDPLKRAHVDEPGHRPLCIMKADGSQSRVIVDMGKGRFAGSPKVSSDGRAIAFDVWTPRTDKAAASAVVYVVGVDGKGLKEICKGSMPTWAPGNNQLTFFRHGTDFGLWVIGKDGKGLEQLNGNGNSPRWSPDGNRMAFVQLGNKGGVAIHNPETGADNVIAPRTGTMDFRHGLDWSPDGKRLCVQRNFQGDQICLIDVKSGQIKVRYNGATGHSLSWSPDGEKILFWKTGENDNRNQLYVLNPDSEDPPVRVAGQPTTQDNADASWSPDGEWIVFTSGLVNLDD